MTETHELQRPDGGRLNISRQERSAAFSVSSYSMGRILTSHVALRSV